MRENGPRAAEVTTMLVFEFCLTGWGCSDSYLKLHTDPLLNVAEVHGGSVPQCVSSINQVSSTSESDG